LARCEDDRFELDMLIEHAASAARAAAAFLATRGGEDESDAATPPAEAPPPPAEKPTRERSSDKSAADRGGDKASSADKTDGNGGGGSGGEFLLRASHARVVRLIYGENSGEVRTQRRCEEMLAGMITCPVTDTLTGCEEKNQFCAAFN
jgi:hypothetical protein